MGGGEVQQHHSLMTDDITAGLINNNNSTEGNTTTETPLALFYPTTSPDCNKPLTIPPTINSDQFLDKNRPISVKQELDEDNSDVEMDSSLVKHNNTVDYINKSFNLGKWIITFKNR